TEAFQKTFHIAIQLGSILSVLLLYGRRFMVDKDLWGLIGVAFVPTAVLGFLFYPLIKGASRGKDGIGVFFLGFVGLVL
ncbi:hypothetical protein L6232_26930, partial [Shewanella sp. C31]|nr:hypothetical protein [Shewanella electrica]